MLETVRFTRHQSPPTQGHYLKTTAGAYVTWDSVPSHVEVDERFLLGALVIRQWLDYHGYKILRARPTVSWGVLTIEFYLPYRQGILECIEEMIYVRANQART